MTYAQENDTSVCDLQSENQLWKAEYEKAESKAERIELIKSKIKSDSIYEQSEPKIKTVHSPTIFNEHKNKNGIECGCKILFILHYKKRRSIIVSSHCLLGGQVQIRTEIANPFSQQTRRHNHLVQLNTTPSLKFHR